MDDRSMFLKMLEKQQQSFEEIDNIDNILLSKGKSTDVLHVTASPNCNNNSHSPTIASNCPIVNISSPISMKKVTKKSKRKKREVIHLVQALIWWIQALLLSWMRTFDVNIHIAANESINSRVKDQRKPESGEKFDLNERQMTVEM